MEVLYHIRPYELWGYSLNRPEIEAKNLWNRYLQFTTSVPEKWPLTTSPSRRVPRNESTARTMSLSLEIRCSEAPEQPYSGLPTWVWVNTYRYIFSGMNIHLPAILGFTRYQGFDPSPHESNWQMNYWVQHILFSVTLGISWLSLAQSL